MSQKNFYQNIATFLIVLTLSACSSQNEKKEVSHVGHETQWDHQKIREVRAAEKAQKPSNQELDKMEIDDFNNCHVMSQSEMIRAKASACRKLDARAGFGADAFCCPQVPAEEL